MLVDFEQEVVEEDIFMPYSRAYDETIKFMEMEGEIDEKEFLKHVEMAIVLDGIAHKKGLNSFDFAQKAVSDAIVRLAAEKRITIV